MSEERLIRIEGAVVGLQQQIQELRDEAREGQRHLQEQIESSRRETRVLYEAVRDDIKALAPDFAPIRREFNAADARLYETIDQRLTPLETWAKDRRKPT